MIVQVENLPDSARQPLLLAYQFHAMGSFAKASRTTIPQKSVKTLLAEYKKALEDDAEGDPFLQKQGDFDPEDLWAAAARAWGHGLTRLQFALATGAWLPTAINLTESPGENTLLSYNHSARASSEAWRMLKDKT